MPSLMCRWWSSRPTRTTALSPLRPSMSSHWMTWQQVGTVDIGLSCLYLLQVWPPPPLVCGFEAFINGKHIIGEVKEKEQAHREYREAISKGHGAYLMDEETPVSGKQTLYAYMYRNLPIIRPWARKLSGSSKRGVGLFLSVLLFHSKVRPPYMLYP